MMIWEETLEHLERQMTRATFDTWLAGTYILERVNGTVKIAVKNRQAKEWLQHRLNTTIERALSNIIGEDISIEYMVPENENQQIEPKSTQLDTEIEATARLDGFTPLFDELAHNKGTMTALVYGVVWRHCKMSRGCCDASVDTLARLTDLSPKTIRRHLKLLCDDGYLVDTTPNIRNKPHTYIDGGRFEFEFIMKAKSK